jgi:mutator protein MutT
MITVTAAILEKDGLILAARKRPGLHLAGYWEFPGGKIEENETAEQCLKRELQEELGVRCEVGDFFTESIHDYGVRTIRLLAYHVTLSDGDFQLSDHDEIRWLAVDALHSLQWAPADIPIVQRLIAKHLTEITLHYYNSNAEHYIRETINRNMADIRDKFLGMLASGSHILDLGCGSGRDSRIFLDRGFKVTAIDASTAIAAITSEYLAEDVLVMKAQDLCEIEKYAGIWACASLLHIPDSEMPATLQKLADALRPGGVAYISLKVGISNKVDSKGRFISSCTLQQFNEICFAIPHIELSEQYESESITDNLRERWLNIFINRRH